MTLGNKLLKSVQIIFLRRINFVMVPGQACNNSQSWLERQETALKLITFVNKILTASCKMPHVAKADFSTDAVADRRAKLVKEPNNHSSSSGFSVGTGNGNQF